jgi:hypothetical protein
MKPYHRSWRNAARRRPPLQRQPEHDFEANSVIAKSIRPSRQATIFINKLEAARRQIDAAIRMTFANEDELAIHTVAAAAYRIVRDLLEKQGRFDFDELLAAGIYSAARSLAAGELPQGELDDLTRGAPQLRDRLAAMADEMRAKLDTVPTVNFSVRVNRGDRIAEWNRLSAAANFLKHADKDADTHITLAKLDNDEIIIRAVNAYISIFRQPQDIYRGPPDILHRTPEMAAFHIWWMSRHTPDQLGREYGDEFAQQFQRLSPYRRRRACLKLIRLFTR